MKKTIDIVKGMFIFELNRDRDAYIRDSSEN